MKKNYQIKHCGEFYKFWQDRTQYINRFDYNTSLHFIPEGQLDIQHLLTDPLVFDKVWKYESYIDKIVQYCKCSVKLVLTKQKQNIDLINNEYNMNDADRNWCEKTIPSLMLKVANMHLPYLFGILMGHMSYKNAITHTKQHCFQLQVKYSNGQVQKIYAPKFAVPQSVIKHFVQKFDIATDADKNSIDNNNELFYHKITNHCKKQLQSFKYINFDTLNKIGYQSFQEAEVVIQSCFECYKKEFWQSLNEKEEGKPLLHSEQMDNLLKNETSTSMIEAYMANQLAPYVSTKGSMICELLNSFLESFLRCKRIKSIKVSWMEVILQFVKWNLHVMKKYINGQYNYHGRLNTFELNQMVQLCNRITHTTYIATQYYDNNHYYHIDNKSQKWIAQQAAQWFKDCQLKPNKPHWDVCCYNELKVWVVQNCSQRVLSYNAHCHQIEEYFHHIWNFDYIAAKAAKMGVKVLKKDQKTIQM